MLYIYRKKKWLCNVFVKCRRETNEKKVSDQPAYRPGMASNFLESLLDNSQNQMGSHQKQDGTFKNVQDENPITVLRFQWVQVDFLGGSPLAI